MTISGVGPVGPSGLWLSRAFCTSWRSSNSFPVACNLSDNNELEIVRDNVDLSAAKLEAKT